MRTIVIHSIHPGEGKTKVAKELAGYVQLQGKQVLLADLDFITDPHSRALGLPSSPNLEDLLIEISAKAKNQPFFAIQLTNEQIAGYLLTHQTGLKVLSSENSKKLSNDQDIAQKLRTVVRNLRQLPYDLLIIDTDSSNRDYNQAILNEADDVLIVMDNFRYNVKDLVHYLGHVNDLGYSTKNFKIVLNKIPSPVQVPVNELEEESGLKVISIIPVLTGAIAPSHDKQTEDISLVVFEPGKNPAFVEAIRQVLNALNVTS